MSVISIETLQQGRLARLPTWFWLAAGACVLAMIQGPWMLRDTDTYWQIKVGQWIIDHRAVPYVDIYSFTKAGAPWMSSSWLSQVLLAVAYALAGWTGVIMLSALAISATFALLFHVLDRHLPSTYAAFAVIVAFVLSGSHFLARPHVLVMPVMVAWVAGLIAASDRRVGPSFWLLPLIALWANLHGGFVLGLALIGPIALDALWNAEASQRKSLAMHWALFGFGALVVCCLTPYGWNSLLAVRHILALGELLTLITEWAPVNFAHFSVFEGWLLLLIGAALYFGVVLPPLRILLTLGLLHMAFNHVRNVEVFALLVPIVLAAPLATLFGLDGARPGSASRSGRLATAMAVVIATGAIGAVAASQRFRPLGDANYEAAIAVLREHKVARVLNEYGLGGYLIWAGMPTFIDGRAELYGEKFVIDHSKALSLQDPVGLFRLLDRERIDATLLDPATPAALLLDHVDGWTRVFANDSAVIHVRTSQADTLPLRLKLN